MESLTLWYDPMGNLPRWLGLGFDNYKFRLARADYIRPMEPHPLHTLMMGSTQWQMETFKNLCNTKSLAIVRFCINP